MNGVGYSSYVGVLYNVRVKSSKSLKTRTKQQKTCENNIFEIGDLKSIMHISS